MSKTLTTICKIENTFYFYSTSLPWYLLMIDKNN